MPGSRIPQDLVARASAATITCLVLLGAAHLLLRTPVGMGGAESPTPLLRLILRDTGASTTAQPADSHDGRAGQGSAETPHTHRADNAPPLDTHASRNTTDPLRDSALSSRASVVAHTGAGSVHTPAGQVKLPPGMASRVTGSTPGTAPGTAQARDMEKQRNIFERRDPLNYTPTRFAKDWKSDGSLAEVAGQAVGRYLDKLGGRNKDQPAAPRPPPQVAFNPALHERAQDLGSEATGDAWRAAPIAFAPAPGAPGDAAPAIQQVLDQLQRHAQGCPDAAKASWLSPLRAQLAALQRIEHRQTHGPDPGAVALLAQQRDLTHDLARRAAWYAGQKLDRCKQMP